MTTLVKLKAREGVVVQGCDIYIGKEMNMGRWEIPKSPFYNPFKEKGLEGVKKYFHMLVYGHQADKLKLPIGAEIATGSEAMQLIKSNLYLLQNKVLGCWCDGVCHGHVLIYLTEKKEDITWEDFIEWLRKKYKLSL